MMKVEIAKRSRHCCTCNAEIIKGEACLVSGGTTFRFKKNLCENCLRDKTNEIEDYNSEHLSYHEDEPQGKEG